MLKSASSSSNCSWATRNVHNSSQVFTFPLGEKDARIKKGDMYKEPDTAKLLMLHYSEDIRRKFQNMEKESQQNLSFLYFFVQWGWMLDDILRHWHM